MLRVLAIGNSFSEDATAYLHQVAASHHQEIRIVNLYIGGCSLKTHFENVLQDAPLYMYQPNGMLTDRYVSIREMLLEEPWDVILTQQASHDSGLLETYYPYVLELIDYIRSIVPGASLYIHQTWAYEVDSDHWAYGLYEHNQQLMYQRSRANYHHVAKDLGLPIIPCGDVIQTLRQHPLFDYPHGGISLCRDGFHMDHLYGRYALAVTLAATLLKAKVTGLSFDPLDELKSRGFAMETLLEMGYTPELHLKRLQLIQTTIDAIV